MSDDKPRRARGRPPFTGERFDRLYVNMPTAIIAALAAEAEARGVSLSALVRTALSDWMGREMPVARIPHEPRTGVQIPVNVEQSAYHDDHIDRGER